MIAFILLFVFLFVEMNSGGFNVSDQSFSVTIPANLFYQLLESQKKLDELQTQNDQSNHIPDVVEKLNDIDQHNVVVSSTNQPEIPDSLHQQNDDPVPEAHETNQIHCNLMEEDSEDDVSLELLDDNVVVPDLCYVESERCTIHPVIDGYEFYVDKFPHFRCKYYKTGCKVRIVINDDGSYEYTSDVKKHKKHIRDYYNHLQFVKNTLEGRDEKNINRDATDIAQSTYVAKSTVRLSTSEHQVRRARNTIPVPKTIDEITLTKKERKYYIGHSSDFYIFGDKKLIPYLRTTKMLFGDGTFKSCPRLFS